jgi:uncharacterized membrane protein SirB2
MLLSLDYLILKIEPYVSTTMGLLLGVWFMMGTDFSLYHHNWKHFWSHLAVYPKGATILSKL